MRLNFGSEPPELTPVFHLLVDRDGAIRWNGRTRGKGDLVELRDAWRQLLPQPAVGVSFSEGANRATRVNALQDLSRTFDCGTEFACVLTSGELSE